MRISRKPFSKVNQSDDDKLDLLLKSIYDIMLKEMQEGREGPTEFTMERIRQLYEAERIVIILRPGNPSYFEFSVNLDE